VKYAFIKQHADVYAVTRMCDVLGVSSSGFYNWRNRKISRRSQENQALMDQIRVIHSQVMETYGSPRMHAELLAQGQRVSLGRVERLMRENGIQAKQARRYKRTYQHREAQAPEENILDRQFYALEPNKKWVSDITFIETVQGWLYLAIVLDLYSRAIVGWSMSSKIDGQLVLDALTMAINQRAPEEDLLAHSDQGSQYTAKVYRDELAAHGITCSMSRKGECHDNAVAESFFHSLKTELVYGARFKTRDEARHAIFKYIELFYNRKRLHSYLDYKAPLEYENMMAAA
jgi:putative transposase